MFMLSLVVSGSSVNHLQVGRKNDLGHSFCQLERIGASLYDLLEEYSYKRTNYSQVPWVAFYYAYYF